MNWRASTALGWLFLVVGLISSVLALFIGYAAAVDYDLTLNWWAALSTLATVLLVCAAILGKRIARWAAVVFLLAIWLGSIDPAIRYFHLISK